MNTIAPAILLAVGLLGLTTGCADEQVAQAQPGDEAAQQERTQDETEADDRLDRLERRMQKAVDGGTLDAAAAAARAEWAAIKTYGSEDDKADMEAIIQPFNEEKKRIRAAVAEGTITDEDGQEQLRVLHEAFARDLMDISAQIKRE